MARKHAIIMSGMSQKKAYTPPKLVVYGTIRQLTRAVNMTAAQQDGGPNNSKSN